MRKITKSLLIASMCVFFSQLNAQIVALKGGLNLSNFSVSEESEFENYKSTPGFHLGANFDIPLGNMFAIETGVLFTTKGARNGFTFGTYTYESTINILNAEFPVSFKAIFDVSDDLNVYVAAGGYIGASVAGVVRYRYDYAGIIEEDTDEINFEDDGLRRLDYGLTFGAGVEIKGIIVGASYDLGLANINDDDNYIVNNRVLKFSLGYRFGWNN